MNTTGPRCMDREGYSLLELMIALVVLGIVSLGIYNLYIYMHKAWLAEDIKAEMQQTARVAFDNLVRDMSMMGYGSKTNDKIFIAESAKLEFSEYMPDLTPAGEWKVLYYLQNEKLYRQLIDPDNVAEGAQVMAENVQTLSYAYYKKDGVNMVQMAAPVSTQDERNNIRRITVSMTLRSSKPMPGTSTYKTITLTADLTPRNLWEGELTQDNESPSKVLNLRVVDQGDCGELKAKWDKSSDNVGVVGYVIRYGTASGIYTNTQNVPVTSLADQDHPQYEFPVDYSPYTTGGNRYYVTVQAYDASHNYSEAADEIFSSDSDPVYPNITSFNQSGNDTINNVRKPGAPDGFTAFSQYSAVQVTWTPPTDSNVVGYRIFRSYSSFRSDDFPIPAQTYPPASGQRIVQLTKETEDGDGWAGPRSDEGGTDSGLTFTYADGSFTDKSTALVGCQTYYYAICAVTCDRTRIMGDASHTTQNGGRYTSSQYATTSASPGDRTGPHDPSLTSIAGWKRVFLNVTWPTDIDYSCTKIYFKEASNQSDLPPFDSQHPEYSNPPYLIPDRQSGQSQGRFINWGTASEHSIIFNSTGSDLGDDTQPTLDNNKNYSFRCVAFDECGIPSGSVTGFATTFADLCSDDPCGAPRWQTGANRYVWVNSANSNMRTNTWTTNEVTGNLQLNLELAWTGVVRTDPATALDFYGYKVSKNTSQSTSGAALVGTTEWDNKTVSAIEEGSVQYFGIQATDCVYQNITINDVGVTANCGGTDTWETYDYIKANNISAPLWSNAMKAGRLALYNRTDTQTDHPEYNVARTEGEFHNKVKFYLENTSQGDLVLNTMKLLWDNSAARLKTVTIGPIDDGQSWTISGGLGQNGLTELYNIDATITNHATGTGRDSASNAIPVTLEFCNSDESVNEFDNMKNNTFIMELIFTNNSMLRNSSGAVGVSGFTTGPYNEANPITFNVTGGPSINYVRQSKPVSPTNAFEVADRSTDGTMPSGFPEVNGGQDTYVVSNVTSPSTETISSVTVYYTYTDISDVNPMDNTFTALTATGSGANYIVNIPGSVGKGVWYYVKAITNLGNFSRKPEKDDSFYYYRILTFDPCLETPSRPTGLTGTPSSMGWNAPTTYEGGSTIDLTKDSLTYKVYRKVGLTGDYPVLPLMSSIQTLTYTDATFSTVSSMPVVYAVSAKNSCTTHVDESQKSDPLTICPHGSVSCQITASPADIYAGQDITVNVGVCSASNNGLSNEAGQIKAADTPTLRDDDWFNLTEVGDTGSAAVTVPTTMKSSENTVARLLVIPAGQVSDTITITGSTAWPNFIPTSCSTATVHAYANACDNTPKAPASFTASLQGSNANLIWSLVTQNTDNSNVTYSVPASLEDDRVGDDIAGYEVWSSNANTDPNTSLTGWSLLDTLSRTTTTYNSPIAKNTTKWYTVRAIDTCSIVKGTFTAPRSVTR